MIKKKKNKNAVQEAPAADVAEITENVAADIEDEVDIAAAPVSDETIVVDVEESVGSLVAELMNETESYEYDQEADYSEQIEAEEYSAEDPVPEEEKGPRPPWYKTLWKWAVRLRSLPLAIPVIVVMVILALRSLATLPDTMIIGDYELTKQVAVYGPVAATSLSLLMMFISKRIFYPWLISVFTLILPIFIQFVAPFFA